MIDTDFLLKLINGLQYLWLIFFIMIVAGIAKEKNLFMPVYSYIKNSFHSNRVVLFLISAFSGVLPIEGRVTVSAGVLDTITHKNCEHNHGREKMGIVDYLSTHHYYLWSPLEKTVIIPMATFSLTYTAWLGLIWPLLFITAAFIFYYIFYKVKEEDINIEYSEFKISSVIRNVLPFFLAITVYIYTGGDKHVFVIFGGLALYYVFLTQTWNYKKLLSYINWEVLLTVAVVIILGNYFKSQEAYINSYIRELGVDITTLFGISFISIVGLMASFFMGSSGKFIALAVLMSTVFGKEYFLWFFVVDYVGYLLSPTHKCVMVGNKYFGTPMSTYYSALGVWSILMLTTAGLITFYN
ncbi:MAG: DUF401 family protein [Proteobacteria bacterium]|nr:DUF401 family protein [Pseudomonadota bacterium]NBP14874.1 DUF401 family protein [bacterium]